MSNSDIQVSFGADIFPNCEIGVSARTKETGFVVLETIRIGFLVAELVFSIE